MPEHPDPKRHPHPWKTSPSDRSTARTIRLGPDTVPYAELAVTTNFTFLTGAGHPEEFVERASELGHAAAAITDRNTIAGIVRAHVAAKEFNIPLAVGCRLSFIHDAPASLDTSCPSSPTSSLRLSASPSLSSSPSSHCSPPDLLVFPTTRDAYARLSRLLTLGKRRAPKGECHLTLHDLIDHHEGLLAVILPPRPEPGAESPFDEQFIHTIEGLARLFDDDRLSIGAAHLYTDDDHAYFEQLADLSIHAGVPLLAINDAHYHTPARRALQDVLTCIRHGCTLDDAGFLLLANAERHLKRGDEMLRLFERYSWGRCAVERSAEIARRAARFSLDELKYEYPDEVVPPGKTAMQHLVDLTWLGAAERYPDGVPQHIVRQIRHELHLIDELSYAPYFLTVHDLVVYARSRGILCQGRGAAANSAVCYCIGVTAVDPDRIDVLFERFISKERNEPPDIDIDFEHERREEVIQYIYEKYGRDRAALTAEVITYRGRSAVREVGKALGLSLDCVDRLARNMDWWDLGSLRSDRVRELGVNPDDPTIQRLAFLAQEILGFPRHLSQHVGGFVITRGLLSELVPIENAAMDARTVIEWDKDDIDAMGMLKVDCLGLGMLTCLNKAFEMVNGGKRRSDGATERQRDPNQLPEAVTVTCRQTGDGIANWSTSHVDCANASRSDCVAKRNGTCTTYLSCDGSDAGIGAIWPDESDAPCFSFHSIKHCGGAWAPKPAGLPSTSSNCPRLTCRASDANGVGSRSRNDAGEQSASRTPVGGRSNSAGTDSKFGEKNQLEELRPESPLSPDHLSPSSLRRSVAPSLSLLTLPPRDKATYDMICRADTVGVFQIESRAQMSMLPRLKPRTYYDLVIEVAIVRPGPIQGKMVHPYLRRRNGEEPVTYPNAEIERVLGKTLGVPLFQEQAMQLAIVAAGFTPGEADKLRRAMAGWKRKGHLIYRFGRKLIDGMLERGYPREFAENCFEQIKGFSEYGFPESHAASFALLVYASAYLKCHHPAAFAAALINSQPMGFYAPAQIIRDAIEHGVEVRPIDVNLSAWDCTLEEQGTEARRHEGTKWEQTRKRRDEETECQERSTQSRSYQPSRTSSESHCKVPVSSCLFASVPPCLSSPPIRLGMRLIKGLRREEVDRISAAVCAHGPFDSITALRRHASVHADTLRRLASADAFQSMGLDRQRALWEIRALRDDDLPLFDTFDSKPASRSPSSFSAPSATEEAAPILPAIPAPRQVALDYASTGVSLKAHPLTFLRAELTRRGVTRNQELRDASRWPQGRRLAVAGIVLVRQRPATASGIIFMTIEDETGIANLIVKPKVYDRHRAAARHAIIAQVTGRVERMGEVVHVQVSRIEDIGHELAELTARSRDFH